MNRLYYGDNLDILPQHIADESVDLVYLDPPFNSNANYNILFAEKSGEKSASQIRAFDDTWHWNEDSEKLYYDLLNAGGKLTDLIKALRGFLGENDMMAYLVRMAATLRELRRALKPTGSIYLHCDPTAGHYLKLVMDGVFGPKFFKCEIVWQRSSAHNDTAQGLKQPGHIHDCILFFTKSDEWTWNPQFTEYSDAYIAERFKHTDQRGRYKDADLTAAKAGGDTSYDWPIKRPVGGAWIHDVEEEFRTPREGWEYKMARPSPGRYWAYSIANMRAFAANDELHYFSTGMPRLKQYADEMKGVALQDIWTDIPPLNSQAKERLGYPTQKPEALLERILSASSNEGDVVLDPFCGCGTTVAVAQKMNRKWIGIDVTNLSITLIRHRLKSTYGPGVEDTYEVIGEPASIPDAEALAKSDPYQFQWWALGLVGARPVEQKKGADKGIDGRLFFFDGQERQIILSVKAGHVTVNQVRDLRGVLDREQATLGVFLCFEAPTKPMLAEAASAGFYQSQWGLHPKIQILTIDDLFSGKRIDFPAHQQTNQTFKAAPKAKAARGKAGKLNFEE